VSIGRATSAIAVASPVDVKLDVAVAAGRTRMTISVCLQQVFVGMALMLFWFVGTAHAATASVPEKLFDLSQDFPVTKINSGPVRV
jgi:hypothetical protein